MPVTASVIRSSSTRYNTLPPPNPGPIKTTLVIQPQNSTVDTFSDASLKRRRAAGVTDLQIPAKFPRPSRQSGDSVLTIKTPRTDSFADGNAQDANHSTHADPVQAYLRKYPVTRPVPAEEEELFCVCLRPEDGRPKIECANGADCLLRWFHVGCIGLDVLPDSDGKIRAMPTFSVLIMFQSHGTAGVALNKESAMQPDIKDAERSGIESLCDHTASRLVSNNTRRSWHRGRARQQHIQVA